MARVTVGLLIFLACSLQLAGQPYRLNSATFAGGGLWLRGGGYVSGLCVGQQVASGELAAGPFRVTLGFWHGSADDTVGVREGAFVPGTSRLEFGLKQSAPNPFSRLTEVSYTLPVQSDVSLRVYGPDGRLVTTLAHGRQPAGRYTVSWDVSGVPESRLPRGTYFCRLVAGDFSAVRKMVKVE